MCENYSVSESKINQKTKNFHKTIDDLEKDIAEFKQKQIYLRDEVINKETLLKSENEIKSVIFGLYRKFT